MWHILTNLIYFLWPFYGIEYGFLKTIIYLSFRRICDQFCEDMKSINDSNIITSVLILKMMRIFILYIYIYIYMNYMFWENFGWKSTVVLSVYRVLWKYYTYILWGIYLIWRWHLICLYSKNKTLFGELMMSYMFEKIQWCLTKFV
jgi:hypothetical protein